MTFQSADTSMIFSAPVPFSSMWPFTLEVPFVVTLSLAATGFSAALVILLGTPFVVGTFGDLLGVTFDTVDESGFRIGVIFVAVDDTPSDVLVAGLY